MASDLARLFVLAREYYLNPAQYQSRADSYEVKGKLYLEFITLMMSPDEYRHKLSSLSRNLGVSHDEILLAGTNLLKSVIFSGNRNYYETLGLKRDVSSDAIRKQYRLLIALFHPDICAARDLDGESISALLNQSYNVLKKKDSRRDYDETLSLKSGFKQSAKSYSNQNNDRSVSRAQSTGMLYKMPVIYNHPKLVVWSLLIFGFGLMIYISMLDTRSSKPGIKIAHNRVIEVREALDESSKTLPETTLLAEVELGEEYLQQSIQSVDDSSLLDSQRVVSYTAYEQRDRQEILHEVSSTISEEKIVNHSVSRDMVKEAEQETERGSIKEDKLPPVEESYIRQNPRVVEQPKPVVESPVSIPAKKAEPEVVAVVSHENYDRQSDKRLKLKASQAKVKAAKSLADNHQLKGFDGGPVGRLTDIDELFTNDIDRDDVYDGSYLMPPELMVMQFIQGYESGDIHKFSRLFADDIKTNNESGLSNIIRQYSALFDQTSTRKIQINELKVKPQSDTEVLLITNIKAEVQHVGEPSARHYDGSIVFRLVIGGPAMKIAEMAHSVK